MIFVVWAGVGLFVCMYMQRRHKEQVDTIAKLQTQLTDSFGTMLNSELVCVLLVVDRVTPSMGHTAN